MDTEWNCAPQELEETSHAWNGTPAKARLGLQLFFAKAGKGRAFFYRDCEGVDWEDGMVKIYFTHATVVCFGQHLDALVALVVEHAAAYIREQHKSPFEVKPEEPFIARIEIQSPNVDALMRKP